MVKWCPLRAIGLSSGRRYCVDPADMGKTGEDAKVYLEYVDAQIGCWGAKCAWHGHSCPIAEELVDKGTVTENGI